MMSDIGKLFKQSSHYFAGQVILAAAGLVSFPILTRILSVSDYGILGLISVTIFITQAVARLGAPSAIVRFYAEFAAESRLQALFSTVFFGYGSLAIIVPLIFLFVVRRLPANLLNATLSNLLSLVSIIIVLNCLISIVTSTLRAEQKTTSYNLILITQRYGALTFGVLFLVLFSANLFAYYAGHILSALIISLILLPQFLKKKEVRFRSFSLSFFKASLRFGAPLTWSELGHLALSYADRYLIQYYLGSKILGVYTAGYNITTYVTEILMYPINYALDPIYMEIYSNKGKKETSLFLNKAMKYFLLLLFPMLFGFIAVARDLIQILASVRYVDSYTIVPYVISGNALYACQVILNAGLVLSRKTHILMLVKIISCILNILLNLILIPSNGMIGAAQATLLSYTFYIIFITYFSFKELPIKIPYSSMFLYLAASLTMFTIITRISLNNNFLALGSKVSAGVTLYTVIILIFDSEIRAKCRHLLKNLINSKRKAYLDFSD